MTQLEEIFEEIFFIQYMVKDKTNDNIFDLTPVLQKVLSSTSYTGTTTKDDANVFFCFPNF